MTHNSHTSHAIVTHNSHTSRVIVTHSGHTFRVLVTNVMQGIGSVVFLAYNLQRYILNGNA